MRLEVSKSSLKRIETGTAWYCPSGGVNAGTVHTAASMPVDIKNMFFDGHGSLRKAPFMVDDPLCLTHPTKVRHNPDFKKKRNMLAAAEWWNVLPSFDGVLAGGMSLSFFMAAVNIKVVHASSLALNYGLNFTYSERWPILGFRATRALGIFSAIPALIFQMLFGVGIILFKIPFISQKLLDIIYPPGAGPPDFLSRRGTCEVYSEVTAKAAAPTRNGNVDRAACHIRFQGDASNLVTSQVVCESALSLLHNRSELPPRSDDGFGTSAELVGKVLLKRLKENKVRKVEIETKVQKDGPKVNLNLLV